MSQPRLVVVDEDVQYEVTDVTVLKGYALIYTSKAIYFSYRDGQLFQSGWFLQHGTIMKGEE